MNSAPPPSAPSRRDDRRRAIPWLVSAAIHAALLAWWSSLADPPRQEPAPEPELRPIELVELPPAMRPLPEPASPDEPPVTEAPPPPEASEASEPSPTPSRRVRSPPDRSPTEPNPVVPPTEGPARPGAVALLGLRQPAAEAPAGSVEVPAGSGGPVLRPQLPAPVGSHQVTRKVGAERPLPAVQDDAEPRSLAEAGFRKRRSGKVVFRDKEGRFRATLLPDGRVHFNDMPVAAGRNPETNRPQVGMAGLAEALRKASGQELYIKEKKRLLERTFDLRLQMAIRFASDKIDRRLASLYRELLELWSDSSTSEAARRAAIFERWDECEELPISLPGFEGVDPSQLDLKRREAGAEARETIERFIRRQLPRGSAQGYSDQELRELNARRHSRDRFTPY